MVYIIIALVIIIGILGYKLFQKQKIDTEQRNKLADEVQGLHNQVYQANNDLANLREKTEYEKYKLEECKKDLQAALDVYQDITDNKLKEIDASMEEQRQKRQEDLDKLIDSKQKDVDAAILQLNEILKNTQIETEYEAAQYWNKVYQEKKKYESLLEPIKQYEKEKQARLFYTIQLPEEYQADIEFLLTTVATKVQHPDIISKLVWAEYVKPNLDDTFKRIEIQAEPGIYKLTSLINNKCYIGRSTNVKTRISDHFKSAIGIKSIADQAVHHAILKEGFWNWQIEIITYCDKEQLNELEKYYIEFFKAQEFGYNKNSGGGG